MQQVKRVVTTGSEYSHRRVCLSLIEELKRRNVFRVGLAYVVVAWLTAQVADLVLENITAPDWLMQTILLFLAIGFPLALIFAWAFEVTPEGIKKEKDVDRSQSITPQTGRKLNGMIMAVLVIAVAYFAYDKFALRPASDATAVETASQGVETPTAVAEELPREKSIAVLPFANRSSRAEDEFFTEGIHDDLLTHLAKIGSMKVISRTSVLRYKDTKKSIPEIAAELKVTTVLEGGIQRSGEQIRINVQLIDAETDEHLWAEIFDRKLTAENLFAIQSEISTKIAEALEATLSPEEESRLKEVPTTNMAAYNAYLRGRQLQEKRTSADLEQALAEFTRATELDPNYALAWVGVADSAALLSSYGTYDWNESNEVEDRAIKKALAINSELGEAYASLAGQYAFREQHDEAEAAYKKAIDLSPNYARAYHWYSGFLSNTPDRLDQSLALLEKASELDPLSSILQSGVADRLGRLGRYDEAEAQYLKVIELDPDFAANYNNLSGFYSDRLGRFAEALKWSRVAREKDPGNITLLFRESLLNLHVQDYAAVEALHQEMLDMDSQHWSVGFTDAVTNMSRGNFAGAAEAVQWVLPKVAHQPNFQQFVGLVFALDRKFTQAREVVEQAFPAWKDPAQWESMIRLYTFDACLVAGIFAGTGDADKAQKLQEQVIEYYALLETKLDHAYTWAPLDCLVASGDHDRALDLLETQVENGFIAWWWVNYEWPWWDEIRTEPRFQAAMQSIQDQVAVQRQLIEEMNL
jgi:TolB-like protein/Tfp pilus assembly protein PilF